MKKNFLLLLVAACAVVACDKSETIDEKGQKQGEVAFSPISMPATKAPISTTDFPDDNVIYVSASNNKAKFFEAKTFKKDGSVWKNYVGAVQTPLFWGAVTSVGDFFKVLRPFKSAGAIGFFVVV